MAEELTDAQVDEMLDRFDQTDPKLQRRIIVRFIERATYFELAVQAVTAAPVPSGGADDHERLAAEYASWHEQYVGSGPLAAPPGKKAEAVSEEAAKCRHCSLHQAVAGDKHGRCGQCQDMVPGRRGWRQLGVYE